MAGRGGRHGDECGRLDQLRRDASRGDAAGKSTRSITRYTVCIVGVEAAATALAAILPTGAAGQVTGWLLLRCGCFTRGHCCRPFAPPAGREFRVPTDRPQCPPGTLRSGHQRRPPGSRSQSSRPAAGSWQSLPALPYSDSHYRTDAWRRMGSWGGAHLQPRNAAFPPRRRHGHTAKAARCAALAAVGSGHACRLDPRPLIRAVGPRRPVHRRPQSSRSRRRHGHPGHC